MNKALALVVLSAVSLPVFGRAQEVDVHVYGTFLPFLDNVRATGATAPGLSPDTGGAAQVAVAAYTGASLPNRGRITSGTSFDAAWTVKP